MNLRVSKMTWSSDSDTLEEISINTTIHRTPVTNHTKCRCLCTVLQSDCDNRTEEYSPIKIVAVGAKYKVFSARRILSGTQKDASVHVILWRRIGAAKRNVTSLTTACVGANVILRLVKCK